MKRTGFLKLALVIGLGIGLGIATGASLRVTDAAAAPLSPAPLAAQHDVQRAVTSGEQAGQLAPQQVRWGRHGGHGHWHHRHGGWHHRHWHRHHHWGWRHHWHHHHWHHRHW